MKVALVRHMLDEPQGGARLIALLARDLRELGEEVKLYCYGYDRERCFPDLLRDLDVRYVRPLSGGSRVREYETGWRRAWLQLRRYFLEARALASIIDADTSIVNPHEWLAHRSAGIFARPHGVPVVWTFNDPSYWHVHAGSGWKGRLLDALGRYDTRQVNRFCAVTTLSRSVTGVATRAFRVPVHLMGCGIDASAARRRADSISDSSRTPLRLLSVGVLSPPRRLEDALEGIAIARDRGCECRYVIIGTDRFWPAYGQLLRMRVASLRLAHVVDLLFDSVPDADLEAAYAQADVAVFPNEQQAWGLAQLETIARGIPTIVSRGAGVSEVLADGAHALLVDPRRPDQIAESIVRLASDPGLRQRLRDAGREFVLQEHTSRHYALRMRELYRRCVEDRLLPARESSN